MSYATITAFKVAVGVENSDSNENIQRALDAATEWIDGYTGRVFGVATTGVRLFDPRDAWRLTVPDVSTITELAVDSACDGTFATVIASTQYQLYPLNVGQPGVHGRYREIRLRWSTTRAFCCGEQVRVTGTWGYGSVPSSVEECCILLANRYFRRPAAPFGVIQAPESGEIARLPQNDPDVKSLLADFVSFEQRIPVA